MHEGHLEVEGEKTIVRLAGDASHVIKENMCKLQRPKKGHAWGACDGVLVVHLGDVTIFYDG